MYAQAAGVPEEELSLDSLFTFGLARLLDGIAPLIEAPGTESEWRGRR